MADEWELEKPGTTAPPKVQPAGGRRRVIGFAPDGTATGFNQQQLADGTWYNMSAFTPSPEETEKARQQQAEFEKMNHPETPTPAKPAPKTEAKAKAETKSGSHNTHARLAPSGWKTWFPCTMAPSYCEANAERIFKTYVGRVNRLAPYLLTFTDELGEHEVRAMKIAADLRDGKRTYESLTQQDRDDIKATESSEAAREGTRAHDFGAAILAGEKTVEDIPEDFREHVGGYVEFCQALSEGADEVVIEGELPLFYQEGSTCTMDYGVIVSSELVRGVDLKYGRGVHVNPVENIQFATYGMSMIRYYEFFHDFGPDTVIELYAYQPRHRDADNKPWVLTLADLEAFCREIQERADFVTAGEGLSFAPSRDACMFCDAKGFCAAKEKADLEPLKPFMGDPAAMIDALPDLDDEEKALPARERMELSLERAGYGESVTDEFLVAWFKTWKLRSEHYHDVTEYLSDLAHSGNPAPGTKLVLGKLGNRAWKDEKAADTFLAGQKVPVAERYKKVLKSPAQAEKLIKARLKANTRTANRFEELIKRSDAKPVLALEEDKREAVGAAVDALPELPEDGGFEL